MRIPYLTFTLQGACYAIDAARVREILRLPALTPISEVPYYIIGVVNYRGYILPVMDLGLRLGQSPQPYTIDDHVIVLEQENRFLGVIVNEVHGVQDIALEGPTETHPVIAESAGGSSRFVRHLAKIGPTTFMILNHGLLLSHEQDSRINIEQSAPVARDVGWRQGTDFAPSRDRLPGTAIETMPLFSQDVTPWEREVLLERARDLTSGLDERSAAQQTPMAIVGLSGEYFGVELETVREFTELQRIMPVPCCPPYVVGDMNLRGEILTVVDIRQALQMPVIEAAPTAKVMVVSLGESLVGILVDQIFDVFDLDPCTLAAVPSAIKSINDTYLKGTVSCYGKMLAVLDLQKILIDGGLTVNEEV